jgi:hypothetical protein
MFAAFEIGAEALAAELAAAAAAEAAAVEAARIAAVEAAAATAAEAGAITAAEAGAAQAAQQAGQAGITQIGGATANAPLTSEAVNAAAQQANAGIQGVPQGFEQQLQNVQNLSQGPSVQVASANPTAGLESLQNQPVFQSGQNLPSAVTSPVTDSGITSVPDTLSRSITAPPPPAPNTLPMGIDMPGAYTPSNYPMGMEGQIPANQFIEPGSAGMPSLENTIAQTNIPPPPPPSALESGFDKALKFADKHPFPAMALAYTGANALGLFKPSGETFGKESYDGPLSRYRLSDNFQAGSANPEDFQYTPRRYAAGGIMGTDSYTIPVGYSESAQMPQAQNYARGGSLSESIDSYQKMLSGKPQAAPARSADVGIYYDQDPDTRYQDALTAAQIRQAKVNQRAYVSPPAVKRPTPMGQLQMASIKPKKQGENVEAAHGGIMHSSLGGYAAGGNPRLLKGPGDGMSDNIPATINGRQPARLADGEFVIPADVVSHLGNGSTEAGAKQLHAMMNKVRKARTGNSKQGKNIRPQKYMPK